MVFNRTSLSTYRKLYVGLGLRARRGITAGSAPFQRTPRNPTAWDMAAGAAAHRSEPVLLGYPKTGRCVARLGPVDGRFGCCPLRQRHRCLYHLVMLIGKRIRGGTGTSSPGPGAGGSKPDRQGSPASPAGFRLDAASGVPADLQLARQAGHALRLGYLKPGDQLPKARDVVASLAINPNTVLKAYRELETKGLTLGRPGQGTFIEATLSQVALPELAALRRSLPGWLAAADGAGLDENGIVALFTSALRDSRERRAGQADRGAAGCETEGAA